MKHGLLSSLRGPWRALCALLLTGLLGLSVALPARAAGDDFLEPEQAFQPQAPQAGERAVQLSFRIAPGYYLYREHFAFEAEGATLGAAELPSGKVKFDTTFQKNVETYREAVDVRLPVEQAAGAFTLKVTYQGCADAGLCYPPQTASYRVSLTGFGGDGSVVSAGPSAGTGAIDLAAAAASASAPAAARPADAPAPAGNRVEALLRGGSWWAVVGGFWLMGLLLSFTPCVLPMLPILSSVIAGGGPVSRSRGLMLACAYALGMAVVYTGLGVAAGLAGEGLAAALQQPAVLLGFAMLLAVLALAMFDVYELRLPLALSNHLDGLSRRLPGGRFVGVFLMGGLSALIVSPCVTAPLAGTLVFLSQSRDVWLAGSALFAMSVGMSVPLLLLGVSAGHWLPRSGAWMHAVKRFFGLLLLAVALWVAQPALPPAAVLLGWAALLLVVGFMARPFDEHPHAGTPRVWLQRAAGLAALAWGVLLLAGVASGGRDPLQPLRRSVEGSPAVAATVAPEGLAFQPVRSVEELDARLAQAGRPVVLDFWAEWCVACKEMERFTFSDPAIRARLSGALLLKADVTANTDADKALLKRFQLFGPPGTIFFDAQGRELPVRTVGFESAEDFAKTLEKAGL